MLSAHFENSLCGGKSWFEPVRGASNRATAIAVGLKIPREGLERADKLIE